MFSNQEVSFKVEDMDSSQSQEKSRQLEISQINNFIYLGPFDYSFSENAEFQKLGIDVILNCASEVVYPTENSYIIENYPIIDGDSMTFLEHLDRINDSIHKYLLMGKKIYINSLRGVSRAPAILVYYLMSRKGFTYDKAINILKKKRSVIDVDYEFETQLRIIEEC